MHNFVASDIGACNIPRGYVEPKVIFWGELIKHIELILSCLSSTSHEVLPNIVSYLNTFLSTLVRKVVESSLGGSGISSQTGWYYNLFYNCSAFKKHNVIADSMTDYADQFSTGGILYNGVHGVDYLCMAIEHVGVDSAHDIPGAELSLMQRKYEESFIRQTPVSSFRIKREIIRLPNHVSTNKRVKGWENQPNESLPSQSVPKPSSDSTAFFVGPVFRYYEFVTPPSARLTKQQWNAQYYTKVNRPEWFLCNNINCCNTFPNKFQCFIYAFFLHFPHFDPERVKHSL